MNQFCLRGHDTEVSGRYKSGACKACHREVHLRKYRESPARKESKWRRKRPVWAALEKRRRKADSL